MTVGRFDFRGGAPRLALSAPMVAADTSFSITGTTTGWPTGASSRPFMVIIDRGLATQEKVKCSALSGTTITVASSGRGFDGTTAQDHGAAATVEHSFPANVLDDLSAHVYDTARDDHAQYMLVDGTRAFTGNTAIKGAPVSVATANAAGSADTLALSDHVHRLANGAVDVAAVLATGVVQQSKLASGLRAFYIVADATALAALAPTAGDIAYQVDVKRYLGYDGSAWKPIMSIASGEQKVQLTSAAVTGGPTSGTTELTLATLNIGSQPYGYKLDVAAFWSAHNAGGGGDSTYDFRIKVDTVEKAKITVRFFGGNIRLPLVIPTIDVVNIAATTACAITVTAQRTSGTDNLTEDTAGKVTAKLHFA